jgi:predicted HTH transcriptional regulator
MLPPLPCDDELLTLETFPYMEGFQWEFKETPINNEKLLPVVCAFLNGKGGWLLIGIRDIDRSLCGIPECVKDKVIDAFIIRCDNILHQNLIMREDGLPISPKSIYARPLYDASRRMVIVRIEPEPDVTYCCYDGTRYIRLSASNYKMTQDRYYTKHDVSMMLENLARKVKKETADTLLAQQTALEMGAEKVSSLEMELAVTRRLLYEKILAEKREVEEKRRSKFAGFLCGVLTTWL